MDAAFQENPGARRLVAGWVKFALSALALSTVFAMLVVGTRTPLLSGFAFAREFFRSALVLHVAFALVVWFFVCAAAMWTLAAGGSGPVRRAALALACAGAAAMTIAPFLGTPLPVLSNYVPVLDSRIFLFGLAGFIAGVVLCGAAATGDIVRRLKANPRDVWRFGVLLSIAAMAMALVSFAASMRTTGLPAEQSGFELLFWGLGHLLQFVHALLMMTAWIVLGERILGAAVAPQRWLYGLLLLAALPILSAPVIHILHPADGPDFRQAFTSLMTWGSWPAAVLLASRILLQMVRAGRAAWAKPEALPLALSILLFFLGCIMGASINGETTMVTAHYHGTVGAVTMAYMGFGYYLLPAFGFSASGGRLARWQLSLYGAGLLLLAFSLAWLGLMGAPRKTPHSELAAQSTVAFSAMELGGLLSLIGVTLFVVSIMRSTRQGGQKEQPRAHPRDVRLRALVLTSSLVVMIGLTVIYLPNWLNASPAVKRAEDARVAHVQEKTDAEIKLRFEQGVAMLNAREYEHALTAFHRVLQLAPNLTEAHVNTGFALIGLKRYAIARDFFESAIELRKDQVNAYYGLAVALEGLNDIPGALGAMRTYVHLAPAGDAYLKRAEAAVWEWEAIMTEERSKTQLAKKAGTAVR